MALTLVATATLTIPNGQQETTNGVQTGAWTKFGVIGPAGWTSPGVNALHVLVSIDDSTYHMLTNAAGDSAAGGIYMSNDYGVHLALPDDINLWPYFKLKAATAQGAARDLIIVASN